VKAIAPRKSHHWGKRKAEARSVMMNPGLPSIWRKPGLSQMNLTAGRRMYLACGIGGEPRRWRVEVFAFQQAAAAPHE
jgi:hypothetical protein